MSGGEAASFWALSPAHAVLFPPGQWERAAVGLEPADLAGAVLWRQGRRASRRSPEDEHRPSSAISLDEFYGSALRACRATIMLLSEEAWASADGFTSRDVPA